MRVCRVRQKEACGLKFVLQQGRLASRVWLQVQGWSTTQFRVLKPRELSSKNSRTGDLFWAFGINGLAGAAITQRKLCGFLMSFVVKALV